MTTNTLNLGVITVQLTVNSIVTKNTYLNSHLMKDLKFLVYMKMQTY